MRDAKSFRLRAHGLKVKSYKWLGGSNVFDSVCAEVQDEQLEHALFYCNCREASGRFDWRPSLPVSSNLKDLASRHLLFIPALSLAWEVQATGRQFVYISKRQSQKERFFKGMKQLTHYSSGPQVQQSQIVCVYDREDTQIIESEYCLS
eukprot:1137841-Pelagomonas_calceolata.AAC.2